MARFQLELSDTARLSFKQLEEKVRSRVVEKLESFLTNNIEPEPLEGNLKGYYKLRVGDYRIIYEFPKSTVMRVRGIGHRSRVYKELARDP